MGSSPQGHMPPPPHPRGDDDRGPPKPKRPRPRPTGPQIKADRGVQKLKDALKERSEA